MPYTQNIRSRYLSAMRYETEKVWDELGSLWNGIQKDNWKAHYTAVIRKYRASSRFAVMRILLAIAVEQPVGELTDEILAEGFSVPEIGSFKNITMEHAENMTASEQKQYKELLLLRVRQFDPEAEENAAPMIDQMMEYGRAGQKCALDRADMIELGHYLNFTLDEMNFLLLRVLGDNELGLYLSQAADLIDAFCFIKQKKLECAVFLKEWYAANCTKKKKDYVVEDMGTLTQQITAEFPELVSSWSDAECVDEIQKYLEENQEYLDQRPRTASMIYRNLAAYVYKQYWEDKVTALSCQEPVRAYKAEQKEKGKKKNTDKSQEKTWYATKEEEKFLQQYQEVADTFDTEIIDRVFISKRSPLAEHFLFTDGKIDSGKCKEVSRCVMLSNLHLAGLKKGDAKQAFRPICVDEEKGVLDVTGKLDGNGKASDDRVYDILRGKTDPTKADMLYLLWISANFYWSGGSEDEEERAGQMLGFLDSAKYLLNNAMLPAFYPPNVLEDAIMTSMTLEDDSVSPSEIYETICNAFKTNAGKATGVENYEEAFKREVVTAYLKGKKNDKSFTQKDCAEENHVSKASLTIWLKKYRKEVEKELSAKEKN